MNMKYLFCFLVVAAILGLSAAESVRVVTPSGPIVGFVEDNSHKFLGIPYAAAPINENRFQPTKVYPVWTEDFHAINDPPGCPQDCILPPNTCPETFSEDCLFLNIFRPQDNDPSVLHPVMVFFHGGNYKQGYSGGALYDSSRLAEHGKVIVVTVNYRLGALGYLALPDLGINGNFALYDQMSSLHWVNKNIRSFNGNPDLVTIIGQSAGAGSVAALMTTTLVRNYFHRAILHSNPFTIPFRDLKTGGEFGSVLMEKLGCTSKSCLMDKTADEIIQAQMQAEIVPKGATLNLFLPWTPLIDNKLLRQQPLTAFQNGLAADVPTLLGTVTDEGDIFIHEGFTDPVDSFTYQFIVMLIFGNKAGVVLEKFPAQSGSHDHREELIQAANEYVFHCPNRRSLLNLLDKAQNNLYLYHFDHRMSFAEYSWGEEFSMCYDKVCHGGELPFTFNSRKIHDLFNYSVDDEYIASSIERLWTNFAHNGDPNNESQIKKGNTFQHLVRQLDDKLPEWRPFDDLNRYVYHIRPKSSGDHSSESRWYDERCNWWDSEVGYFL